MDTSHCAIRVHSGDTLQALGGSLWSPSGSGVKSRCLKGRLGAPAALSKPVCTPALCHAATWPLTAKSCDLCQESDAPLSSASDVSCAGCHGKHSQPCAPDPAAQLGGWCYFLGQVSLSS